MSFRGDVTSYANSTLSISEQRETQEHIHKALHRNIYLLSLKFPMKKELKECFEEGMLKMPNSLAFNQLAYYLMSIIEPKCITPNLSYLICETKLASQFRKEFLKFVTNVSNSHKGYISPIMPSWLVTAGGLKVTKLMFELSQVAMKIFIMRNNSVKKSEDLSMLNDYDLLLLNIDQKINSYKEQLVHKIALWYRFCKNMERIHELYRKQLELIQNSIKSNMEILEDLINKVKEDISVEDKVHLDEIVNIDSSNFIVNWDNHINDQTLNAENNWEKLSNSILVKSRNCKNTSDEIIQRYTRKSKNDFTLEHNPDTLINYSSEDSLIFSNIIQNGVLHLPSLFKAYNAMLFRGFRMFSFFKIDDKFCTEVEDKKKTIILKCAEAKQIDEDVSVLYKQLKEKRQQNVIPYKRSPDNEWVYEAFNIPQIDPSLHYCFKYEDKFLF